MEENSQRTSLLQKAISKCFSIYIEIVAKTSNISVEGEVDRITLRNSIIGFWHGDSFGLNLLMREIQDKNRDMSVVVTEDKRGNYIENMINEYGIKAMRMPDGIKMKNFLKRLKEEGKRENSTVGIALDGPLGPLKEPKKIAFLLSCEGQKPCILVKSEFSKKIIIKNRWDKYIIPLPFAKIKFTLLNIGIIKKENLRDFQEYKKEIRELFNNNLDVI